MSARFDVERPSLGVWRTGNTGVEGVWHFEADEPGPVVMITCLVHGNELCGAWAVKGLLESGLRPHRGALTLAFCNLAAFDSFDPADHDASRFVDEDMNRQWSAERLVRADSVERTRAAMLRPFVERADWLLDLHSMHEPGPPLLLTGPHQRAVDFASVLNCVGHIVVDEGHADGVRLRDFSRFGLPDGSSDARTALLIECGFHGDRSSISVAKDICYRFLLETGTVEPDALVAALADWPRPPPVQQVVLDVEGAVVAKDETFRFARPFKPLEAIPRAGMMIGRNGDEWVRTPFDDCVLVMPSTRQARAGVTVVRFARQRPAKECR
ncbi:succinylglutamate desuccinylase/aspartoacylase domain-containing protein [Ramlibacter algicola]|uniref:Succinylglutamate desuccinylase/aspartoacylase family protein n=1 Tax=Ramlibacter algicola TaxID=2795217 RepID=A0A934Q463_9BURK|nr:succinylglutamate desuccinylase/aspartoacylase family protein [Ramlibacter algicola]MBK0394710.1 succinylglutamate desuccinylase/aspartoacylase family protein [Ramlibacter algicola]